MYITKKYSFVLIFALQVFILQSCEQRNNTKSAGDIDTKVKELLAGMTLEEKVGQMTQVTLPVLVKGNNLDAQPEPVELDPEMLQKAFGKYKIGSVLNTVNNRAKSLEWWHEIINQIQEVAIHETCIPVLYGIDAIHGTTYTAGGTLFPQEIGLGATFNPELVRQLNEMCAYEMRASNIPWNFSPVQDMGRDPRDSRMWETFSEDVYLNGILGSAAVEGIQGKDAVIIDQMHGAACLKHYLGYNSNSGKDRNPFQIHPRELNEKHKPAFQAPINAGAKSIMVNSGILNGIPVHASYDILTTLLRDEMGFEGVVVTDWADIDNLYNRDKFASSPKEAVELAINAGVDMSMVPYDFDFCDYLVELVNENEVPMNRIDEAVTRILKLKMELGLFESPTTNYEDYPDFGSEKHENLALDAALESITLLKNDSHILPLKKDIKVLISGPNANWMRPMNGGWSYSWQGEKTDEFAQDYSTFLEAIQGKIGKDKVTFVEGVSYDMQGKYYQEKNLDIDNAVRAANEVDCIILFLGENSYCEKPGDLHDLYLSENQADLAIALANTGKPVILVLNEGRPRIISKFEHKMAAVVQTYLPGNFGGNALADILFGDANPNGKLPYTYPLFPNSLINYDYKPSEKQEKMEGLNENESDVAIQYAFGHGLSYTVFKYSNLKVSSNELTPEDSVNVAVTIENTGDLAGKEVVMLFTSDLYASITPDNKRLRRFMKINLDPAQSKTIEFTIKAKDLAFYNKENQLVAEKGDFVIRISDLDQVITLTETATFGEPSKIIL
ncbi:MAG: glycoside hydrolase family 3 C-terminal domain-containing protein [Bacteroidales bacterium]|nr:glycoside hydrolase family 3 C-terminal domain-containing protein [Bacteroidales bacterium]